MANNPDLLASALSSIRKFGLPTIHNAVRDAAHNRATLPVLGGISGSQSATLSMGPILRGKLVWVVQGCREASAMLFFIGNKEVRTPKLGLSSAFGAGLLFLALGFAWMSALLSQEPAPWSSALSLTSSNLFGKWGEKRGGDGAAGVDDAKHRRCICRRASDFRLP